MTGNKATSSSSGLMRHGRHCALLKDDRNRSKVLFCDSVRCILAMLQLRQISWPSVWEEPSTDSVNVAWCASGGERSSYKATHADVFFKYCNTHEQQSKRQGLGLEVQRGQATPETKSGVWRCKGPCLSSTHRNISGVFCWKLEPYELGRRSESATHG